ncbi:RNA polymerase sigma factor [Arcticibacterium luteifluviistationis]|uniref:RNA polymerase sigma factor n=1 Tax=Arcticibacterium luteifluviistationis TaxID=1784714 RepID=UPI001E28519A|nr:sigma-70 family RNA polymerase sigma factor [Arcticibacterium luteifluviistationis]
MDKHQDILEKVAEGDGEAFKQLYDIYSAKVYNLALMYTQNVENAEEISQDVFLKIYQNASKFKGGSAVGTWVYRITVNTSLNSIKKGKKWITSELSENEFLQADFEHPGVLLENKENAKALFKAIEELPESQKMAFILAQIEEMPQKEVALAMDLSVKAVESLLQRAKGNLKKSLENLYPHRRKKKK